MAVYTGSQLDVNRTRPSTSNTAVRETVRTYTASFQRGCDIEWPCAYSSKVPHYRTVIATLRRSRAICDGKFHKRLCSYRRETRATLSISWTWNAIQIAHTDPHVSLRSTFSNWHVIYRYLQSRVFYTHRCSSLNYRKASMQCLACHQQTCLCQLDRTCFHQIRLPPKLLMRPRRPIPPPAHRRGCGPSWRMDTNFGGKSSEPETSRPVEKKFYPPPPAFDAPLGVIPSEFGRDLLRRKTRVPSCRAELLASSYV